MSGQVGKWESGKVGKWESGKVGKWESGRDALAPSAEVVKISVIRVFTLVFAGFRLNLSFFASFDRKMAKCALPESQEVRILFFGLFLRVGKSDF